MILQSNLFHYLIFIYVSLIIIIFSKRIILMILLKHTQTIDTQKLLNLKTAKNPTYQLYQDQVSKNLLNKTQSLMPTLKTSPLEQQIRARQVLRLPSINKKQYKKQQINQQKITLTDQEKQQLHPYIQKYIDSVCQQKTRKQNSCSFLNIVSVKPMKRSISKLSNKQVQSLEKTLFHRQSSTDKKNVQIHENSREGRQTYTSTKINNKYRLFGINEQNRNNIENRQNQKNNKQNDKDKQGKKTAPYLARQKKKSLGGPLKIQKQRASPGYIQWCQLITSLQGLNFQKQGGLSYKAYICKGNNSILIKNIVKNRPWWSLGQDKNQANLYWTQSRSAQYLQTLSKCQPFAVEQFQPAPKSKFQLHNLPQGNLAQKVKSYINVGFQKVLSQKQRNIFCRSSTTIQLKLPKQVKNIDSGKLRMHNHLEFNWNLSNKKALYYNMKNYYQAIGEDPFLYIPQTYHVQLQGDEEWNAFLKGYQKKGYWIVKPGQNSNRGCGIDVVQTIQQIKQIVKNKSIRANGKPRSHIVQRYLMPFLYNKRKFDIRCYMLVTSLNGNMRCYWYEQGYIRTASKQFTMKNLKNRMIHLTNDAVQKHSQNYGKHESGNKLSFNDFGKYLKSQYPESTLDFYNQVYPRMIKLATDAIHSTYLSIDQNKKQYTFQIFGLDFMIDDNFNTWLIQVNTNPCLELSCPLLARIIPSMVQNAFKVGVDPVFPPPRDYTKNRLNQDLFENNKFTLIFNGKQQQKIKEWSGSNKLKNIVESDEQSIQQEQ